MADMDIKRVDTRIKWWLLIVSVLTLVLLIVSALSENVFAEWRHYRVEYAKLLEDKANDERSRTIADQFDLQVDQNVVPALGRIDRCITCHPGVDDPRMANEAQPFRTHPGTFLQHHPPETYGCTLCHQGQGLATDADDAHGRVAHWPYPMFEKQFMYSACAQCHLEEQLYGREGLLARTEDGASEGASKIARGKQLLNEKGCIGCHILRGRGGTIGPDISYVGDKTAHDFDFTHFDKHEPREVTYWLRKHFLEPAEISPGTLMPDLGLSEEDADALTAYVLSLKRGELPAGYSFARRLADEPVKPLTGAELYAQLCSSCHGDRGEASEVPGIRTPALNNYDSLAVASDDYYRFIIAEGRSGTSMPAWGPRAENLATGEIDKIVAHIRGWESPGAPARNVSSRTGDARMGRAYYQGLCGNCHGPGGEGGIGNTLNSPTFLAVASDAFLAATIIDGRPGTAMASWKHLPAQAVSDLLAFMRTWQREAPSFEAVMASLGKGSPTENARVGAILYRGNCAGCHGAKGEGGIGLRLNSSSVLPVLSDEYLYKALAEGRPTTAMPSWRQFSADKMAAIIAFLRTWQNGRRVELAKVAGGGDYAVGEVFFKAFCTQCHGDRAQGGVGPQLANPSFLKAVSDDALFHWIGMGRTETAMKGFLPEAQGLATLAPHQIVDVIAYLRYEGTRDDRPILREGAGDASLGRDIFNGNCASCHGTRGEGSSGPQLNNPTFLRSASDGFLAATMVLGRSGTAMRSMVHGMPGVGQIAPERVQDVVAYLRFWDVPIGRPSRHKAADGQPDRWRRPRAVAEMSARAIRSGQEKFGRYCSGCHGPNGLGVQEAPEFFAPALNNPEFLSAASDGFLLATIARGRSMTPMRPFGKGAGGIASLKSGDINDIVSFIRTWQESYPQTLQSTKGAEEELELLRQSQSM